MRGEGGSDPPHSARLPAQPSNASGPNIERQQKHRNLLTLTLFQNLFLKHRIQNKRQNELVPYNHCITMTVFTETCTGEDIAFHQLLVYISDSNTL